MIYVIYCYVFSDKKLFTPGPLGTSSTVKSAMLRDLGSRDVEFIKLIKTIRSKLVQIAGRIIVIIKVT
jgi:aspartate aminotransferase-like enzyme